MTIDYAAEAQIHRELADALDKRGRLHYVTTQDDPPHLSVYIDKYRHHDDIEDFARTLAEQLQADWIKQRDQAIGVFDQRIVSARNKLALMAARPAHLPECAVCWRDPCQCVAMPEVEPVGAPQIGGIAVPFDGSAVVPVEVAVNVCSDCFNDPCLCVAVQPPRRRIVVRVECDTCGRSPCMCDKF